MTDQTTTDQKLIRFPTAFPIKIMGRNDAAFLAHAIQLVTQHTGGEPPRSIASRESKNARFLSVTVEIMATSRAQLDAIYQTLTDDDQVVMAL